jgi:hypothetical protein
VSPPCRATRKVEFRGGGEARLGSGLDFADRGEYELKGMPERWHVFAVNG